MTPFRNRQSPLTKRMAEDMLVRNLSPRTIDSYTYHVDKFTQHFNKSAEELGPEEIREYQLYLIKEKNVGWSSFNLSGMMHLSVNLLQGKDLTDSDRRLAGGSANLSRP